MHIAVNTFAVANAVTPVESVTVTVVISVL